MTGAKESSVSSTQTEEFVDLLASIAELRKQIEGLDRPDSLPPPGQPLPMEVCFQASGSIIQAARTTFLVHACCDTCA